MTCCAPFFQLILYHKYWPCQEFFYEKFFANTILKQHPRVCLNKFSMFGIYWRPVCFCCAASVDRSWSGWALGTCFYKHRHLVTSSTNAQPVRVEWPFHQHFPPRLLITMRQRERWSTQPREQNNRRIADPCSHIQIYLNNEIKAKKSILDQWIQAWLAQQNRLRSLLK